MKMKKVFKKVFVTVMALITRVLILCLGFWLIDGRSPQAYLVAHALPQTTMEAYEKGKGDMTDKSIVEIPDGVEFPREVKQFKVGSMQVFECPAADDSKPIVLYLHGGDMQGLPPTDLFTGTWEVFYTDIVKTYEKMKAAGVDVRLHVKEKMGHVYPLWPCPEGKASRKEIAEIITAI